MPYFGYILLLATMVAASFTIATAVVSHAQRSRRMLMSSEFGVFVVFGLLTCASLILVYLFVADDYSVKYVQHYSDRSMPLFYKVTSFWGGQDGSLLFWVWVMSCWSAVAIYLNRGKNRDILPYTIVAMMVVTMFFVVLMVFAANPFETYLAGAPTDGRGLNPLLQNPYMVTHPPSLYLGYIGWTIPFCFAIGALAHGKLDYSWIAAMRRWCLVAWVFLSVGLVLGGLWAYEELGWGGYWAWDPVENAAFFPWLTGTAFIHSIQVQERRQMYKLWNLLLIILTFVLTLLGTAMTRSGVVQSVHAFAQSDIGYYFLFFIIATTAVSLWLLIWRAPMLRPENYLESVLSRDFAFLINNWILLASAFFIVFATLFPSLYKAIYGQEVNVGPSFFNLWMIPLGLMLLFLTGVGPLLSWRKSTPETVREQFTLPSVLGALVFLGLWFGGYDHLTSSITIALCAFVTATILQEFWRGTRLRMRNADENPLLAFATLIGRAKRRYGGYIIHFGVVLMFFGFAGNAYQLEEERVIPVGKSVDIGRYTVRVDGLRFENDGQKTMMMADTTVFSKGTETMIGQLTPAKWAYRKPEEQVTTEVAKYRTVSDDLYLVLAGFNVEAQTATLQLKVNPLVNFVWLGCAFFLLGFSVAVWPDAERQPRRVAVRRLVPVTVGAVSLLLGIGAAAVAVL